MIGLPTETEADLEGVVSLVRRLQRVRSPGKRGGNITVSVSTFIPKAHTPFLGKRRQAVEPFVGQGL